MEIARVGVVGCGTMGSGICEVVALAGFPVAFVEVSPEAVDAGRARIAASLERAVAGGKIDPAERDAALERITGDVDFGVLADADLIVEAVQEDMPSKRAALAAVAAVRRHDTIVATNTSALPVIDLAVLTGAPDRMLGFHFFNPPPVMKLIELVTTVVTAPDVVADAQAFAAKLGKSPVIAGDRAGFVANLLLFPFLNQAVGMVEDGYATREDVDAAMRLGAGHPMGPLALMDLIGLDSANAIMERLYEQFHDVRYAPRPLIRQLVSAGFLGRKSGRGFYPHGAPAAAAAPAGPTPPATAPPADPTAGWTTVGVLGSGTMAWGIAQVCAAAGFEVVLRARTMAKAEQAVARIAADLDKGVRRGKVAPDVRDATRGRLRPTAELDDLGGCDLVLEAVAEELELKRSLFAELETHTKPSALLATTTSSLPVVACAMATTRPERVVGLHFFNPATRMRLVEVVDHVRADPEAAAQARAFAQRVGKHPVRCTDRAGFIVNALLFPYLNDAVKMLGEGYASTADIDTAMKLGCGHPMGPFELMDVVGLDVTLSICRSLYAELREPGFAPAPLLGHMVSAGYLGRKTGRGFHVYG